MRIAVKQSGNGTTGKMETVYRKCSRNDSFREDAEST